MDYSVLDFGAVGNGETISTQAIQAAIDAAASTSGGKVTVPAGVYLTGTIWLKSNVELHLCHGAKLLASPNLEDYNEEDAYPQNFRCNDEQWNGKHLIIAHECQNIAISGFGSVDGNGDAFYTDPIPWDGYTWEKGLALSRDKVNLRPGQLISIIECKNIRIQDITLQNATCWNCFLHGCKNAQIRGLKIFAPHENANTDGIDIDTCSCVTVSDCIIDTGDDAIALRCDGDRVLHCKPVCEFITITNCVLASSSSVFRIGVGRGTLRHIRVSNIAIKRGAVGMCFMGSWTPGKYTNIIDTHFSDISADDLSFAFQIHGIEGAVFDNISITNYSANCCAMTTVTNSKEGWSRNIQLKNIRLCYNDKNIPHTPKTMNARGDKILYFGNTAAITLSDFAIDISRLNRKLWNPDPVVIENCPELEGTIKVIE